MLSQAPLRNPLIAIVGATGTGKSQLAVEIAKHFNGEIINGDAMQLYSGLPIITNKLPVEEQGDIPHHLLGQIGLKEEPWTVGEFVQSSCRVIKEIRSRNRLPILVGGTHYYTQSLLFEDSTIASEASIDKDKDSQRRTRDIHPLLSAETATLLRKLREIDPVMAERWHPNDRRKIQRSLEIWYQTGQPASKLYREQARHRTGIFSGESQGEVTDDTRSQLRFTTLLFWVHADRDVLRGRLDRRVDTMMQDGLLAEIDSLESHRRSREVEGETIDRTRGIWQCIGYKQFERYMEGQKMGEPQNEITRLRDEGIEQTQAANRQYAKRQVQWIRIKLLHALRRVGATKQLYILDGTNLSGWRTAVHEQAITLTQQFLEASPNMPHPTELSAIARDMLQPQREYDMSDRPDLWQRQTCEICNVTSVRQRDWDLHLKSRGHRKAAKNARLRLVQDSQGQEHQAQSQG
ncbi:MAG: hypothetical protein M1821_000059 [Bathelium mastoideum]|nr:MAG: hypothetical protein M1821_000059 [Bathelium mastoideum]KAI9687909.1 MAG: hypothetical protein M1822_001991 [Bathelium mastoideum]